MSTLIEHVNALIRTQVSRTEKIVCYGQNISAGSCLSGLTRGLEPGKGGMVLNTSNTENASTGMGFGLMLRGVPSIYFMKQQDFLLLGMDHLVNTWNILRRRDLSASFTVFAIVVDQGFEGPQSCLNNLSDFCSMANVPGYVVNNHLDAGLVIPRHLTAPGFRILGVSQRRFGAAEPSGSAVACDPDGGVIRYSEGGDATVVAFNTAWPQADSLHQAMAEAGKPASLFSVPAAWRADWSAVLKDAGRTGRLVVLDDSKGANRTSDRFLVEALSSIPGLKWAEARRSFEPGWLRPNPDLLEADASALIATLWS